MIKILTFKVGSLRTNCYLIYESESGNSIIIDPGDDAEFLIQNINKLELTPKYIISTHGHYDHNLAVYELKNTFGIPYLISEKDLFLISKMPESASFYSSIKDVLVPKADEYLYEGKKILIEDNYFKVIETPGHTPGSVVLYNSIEKIIFSGDLIFEKGDIGRYDFSYSNKNDLLKSIKKILKLPDETICYSGHGEPFILSDWKKYN